jgi:hypothetical protein
MSTQRYDVGATNLTTRHEEAKPSRTLENQQKTGRKIQKKRALDGEATTQNEQTA